MASPNLLTIPPEIFDHVAAHLPLYATAPTLRSLILSNRHLFIHLHPLLYRHLTLACSPDYRYHRSLDVLLRLRNPETCLGHNVRALYLQCQVPTPQASLAGRLTVNSMTLLKDLILNGRLPYLQRLEIVYGYFRTPEITTRLSAVAISEVKAEAWDLVKDGCPELRTLTVSGWNGISTYDRSMRNQGVCASSFWKVESLSSLTLDCGRLESFKDARKGALVGCLTLIASRLEHLDVAINGSIEPFLKLTFPSITYLAFRAYTSRETEGFDVAIAMDFWKRHPLLESLSLRFAAVHDWMAQDIDSPVFSQDASTFHRLLPNLKHLSITSCDDWPWHSAGTQTLNLPLLKSLTVTSDRPEDMAGVVNTSPQLQELFWFALFPGRRLEGRLEEVIPTLVASHPKLQRFFFTFPFIMHSETISTSSETGKMAVALAKWFPSLSLIGSCTYCAQTRGYNLIEIVRDSEGGVMRLEPLHSPRRWPSLGCDNVPFV